MTRRGAWHACWNDERQLVDTRPATGHLMLPTHGPADPCRAAVQGTPPLAPDPRARDAPRKGKPSRAAMQARALCEHVLQRRPRVGPVPLLPRRRQRCGDACMAGRAGGQAWLRAMRCTHVCPTPLAAQCSASPKSLSSRCMCTPTSRAHQPAGFQRRHHTLPCTAFAAAAAVVAATAHAAAACQPRPQRHIVGGEGAAAQHHAPSHGCGDARRCMLPRCHGHAAAVAATAGSAATRINAALPLLYHPVAPARARLVPQHGIHGLAPRSRERGEARGS